MRPDVVVGATKVVEDTLLEVEVGSGRPGQTLFQRAVHALVSGVLLRLTWRDALVRDAELKPPDVELGQTVDASRGEGSAIVAADGIGKPMLRKRPRNLAFTPAARMSSSPWQESR